MYIACFFLVKYYALLDIWRGARSIQLLYAILQYMPASENSSILFFEEKKDKLSMKI